MNENEQTHKEQMDSEEHYRREIVHAGLIVGWLSGFICCFLVVTLLHNYPFLTRLIMAFIVWFFGNLWWSYKMHIYAEEE